MKKMIDKIENISKNKYFAFILTTILTALFFIICNVLFQIKYETVDDFTIMKIISGLDGHYSIYGVYIHPILCLIIMLLFKTGINVNWYTVFILAIQFISFTTVGTVLINKNKKVGTILYIVIILVIYSRVLIVLNYTNVATICVLAGILYNMDAKKSKNKLLGYVLITLGILLRWKTIAIVFPFYVVYILYNIIQKSDYRDLNNLGYIIIIFLVVYISNSIIYNSNNIYKEYTKFNRIRTYFFDTNVLDYEKNKEIFDKNNWRYEDWILFYTYSFADENFYTTANLIKLKKSLNIDFKYYINKIVYKFKIFFISNLTEFFILFFIVVGLLSLLFILKCNRKISFIYFIVFIIMGFVICYSKHVYRVIISLYCIILVMLSYFLIETINNKTTRISKYFKTISIYIVFLIFIINSIDLYKNYNVIKENKDYNINREIIEYVNAHKENVYVYPNVFKNISLSYSVYEKIPDNTFINLRFLGDWDIYDGQYYRFKERYGINNIITDLYKKENLYLIDGIVKGANNKLYSEHIEIIIIYIKQKYNVNVKSNVIKEFKNGTKIYKINIDNE